MNKQQAKKAGLERRKRRVRAKVFGTPERPRLAVHRTNANIYAQLIDDASGRTLCSASRLTQSSVLLARLAPTRRQLSS